MDKKQLNAHEFEEIYNNLKINLDTLGCVMLDIKPIENVDIDKAYLYYAKDKKKFWIDGLTVDKGGHITLLYGLLKSATLWKDYIKKVLKGWSIASVKIEDVGFFESPYKDEPYYCIVAFVEMTDKLLEGHDRLEFLPHINTYVGYKPHITLAYVKKDDNVKNLVIKQFRSLLKGKNIKLKEEINFGK